MQSLTWDSGGRAGGWRARTPGELPSSTRNLCEPRGRAAGSDAKWPPPPPWSSRANERNERSDIKEVSPYSARPHSDFHSCQRLFRPSAAELARVRGPLALTQGAKQARAWRQRVSSIWAPRAASVSAQLLLPLPARARARERDRRRKRMRAKSSGSPFLLLAGRLQPFDFE